jgi:hypothetical protein
VLLLLTAAVAAHQHPRQHYEDPDGNEVRGHRPEQLGDRPRPTRPSVGGRLGVRGRRHSLPPAATEGQICLQTYELVGT